ncbi:MAG: ADP-forming succinate--CoA ligase subunit beta [Calditrichaeota bacterium]|nr:ADP-forming succinate--CoA ligase subunit beta [Calditrichota bacterium]MCB9366425.1 ADP-forming succinate--CoA ligase subunit beta [Calditrichota bacterium]
MKIHEYQAKQLLSRYGVPVPKGTPAQTADDAVRAGLSLGGFPVVVKAQIHAGGRGKGGGVKLAKSEAELKTYVSQILGMQLVTHQTGSAGQKVQRLLIEEGMKIDREFYAGILLDRAQSRNVFMVSTEGGMDIEEVAAKTPEKIVKVAIDPASGFQPHHARRLAFALGLSGAAFKSAVTCFQNLYKAYVELDCSLVEINPLILSGDKIIALDAKVNFDDNALFRHAEFADLRDLAEEDPAEIEASKHNLNFIKLDGNIGCMVNGAGLAMATMDIIKLHGGDPANFLDVGGGANATTVAAAFQIILADPNVKAILINIFGGIVRCDRVAGGVIEAAKTEHVAIPVVVRLEGNNAELAGEMLRDSGLNFIVAGDLTDAAEKACAAVKG